MPRWIKPEEEAPELECGDRILIIVNEKMPVSKRPVLRLVILEATEAGWDSPDEDYGGYSYEDGVFWAYEKDVVEFAKEGQKP